MQRTKLNFQNLNDLWKVAKEFPLKRASQCLNTTNAWAGLIALIKFCMLMTQRASHTVGSTRSAFIFYKECVWMLTLSILFTVASAISKAFLCHVFVFFCMIQVWRDSHWLAMFLLPQSHTFPQSFNREGKMRIPRNDAVFATRMVESKRPLCIVKLVPENQDFAWHRVSQIITQNKEYWTLLALIQFIHFVEQKGKYFIFFFVIFQNLFIIKFDQWCTVHGFSLHIIIPDVQKFSKYWYTSRQPF